MDSSWLSLSLSSHYTAMEEVPHEPASSSWAELSSSPPKLVDFLGGGQTTPTYHSHHQQRGQEDAAASSASSSMVSLSPAGSLISSRSSTIAAALQHQQQLKMDMAAAAASAQGHFINFRNGGAVQCVGQLDSGEIEGGKQQHVLCKLRQQMLPVIWAFPAQKSP